MIKTIDLFAGAGGLSYGFKMTGRFQFVAAAEINANARKTYLKNIVGNQENFEFIENVVGFDFSTLNDRVGGIDVVIGGPPCQGFSNANRQKNHLISMNNSLIKDYFRAIKQIQPKAFVMENVSMLRSDTHRFYESTRDNKEIDALIEEGYHIPKRKDALLLTKEVYEGVDLSQPEKLSNGELLLPDELGHLLTVLRKNINNSRRLPSFKEKKVPVIIKQINEFTNEAVTDNQIGLTALVKRLITIKTSLEQKNYDNIIEALDYVVGLQKLLSELDEIHRNGLIGKYEYSSDNGLIFIVNSYAVIDYVNAILGGGYVQKGGTVYAEWFGVPQERRRHIVIGIRKDIYEQSNAELELPKEPANFTLRTVADAINDLTVYPVGYTPDYQAIDYVEQDNVSEYAALMREGSISVKNHIATKTSDVAMARFKKIKQGKNFHSLDIDDKATYSKPDRTQTTIYLRLDPTKPSGTVVNVRKSMWIHPTLDRAISVREAARLQSFPDSFEFCGAKDSQYQQVGNAVPPLLAKGIADIILNYL